MTNKDINLRVNADVPNVETLAAIEEVKRMKINPSLGKTYSNVDQMIDELFASPSYPSKQSKESEK